MATKVPFGELVLAATLPPTTGKYYFVHSGTGSNGNSGLKPERALATVDYATDKCTASKGDVVVIMPGHAETVTSSSMTLDKAGVTYVCLGNRQNGPVFTYSAATGTINVTAANVKWIGGYFIANVLDVASAWTVAGDDFTLEGGDYIDSSAILNFLSVVTTTAVANAADGLTIKGVYHLGLNTTPLAFVSILENCDRLTILDCFVDKASTADVGHFLTIADKECLGVRIGRNILNVVGATAASVGIFITGSSTANTGMVHNNLVTSLDTTGALLLTATLNFAVQENYLSGVVAASGTLFPAADNPA